MASSTSNRDSSSSPLENVERSEDQVTIQRRTPRKLRSPRKDEWQQVGSRRTRSNRSSPNSPAVAPRSPDLSSQVDFPALQMSSNSSSSGDRDPFKQDVTKALR